MHVPNCQELEAQAQEQGDDIKINPATVVKPLHRVIADHKDVIKIVVHLNSVMATLKPQVMEHLAGYSKYSELWDEVSLKIRPKITPYCSFYFPGQIGGKT